MMRNRVILAIVAVLCIAAELWLFASESEYVGRFSFIQVSTKNGYIGILGSIFLYGLFALVFGTIPAAWNSLAVMIVYLMLHCKDKKLLTRHYHPPYEDESYFGCTFAMVGTYIVFAIMTALHVTGILEVHSAYYP